MTLALKPFFRNSLDSDQEPRRGRGNETTGTTNSGYRNHFKPGPNKMFMSDDKNKHMGREDSPGSDDSQEQYKNANPSLGNIINTNGLGNAGKFSYLEMQNFSKPTSKSNFGDLIRLKSMEEGGLGSKPKQTDIPKT